MSLSKSLNTAGLPLSVRLARLSVAELRSGHPERQSSLVTFLENRTQAVTSDSEQFDDAYLQRLRSGDDETARHFDLYFRRLIRAKVWGTLDRQREADLIDDVMAAAIQGILRGKPRNASRLPGYICGICSNLTKVAMRPKSNAEVAQADFDRIPDSGKTTVEKLQETEIEQAVRNVLSTLSQRDRKVLVDLFYNGLTRAEASRKRRLSRAQLRIILFHAMKRFKKKWQRASTLGEQSALTRDSLPGESGRPQAETCKR